MATKLSQTIRLGTASPATQGTTGETLALIERIASRAAGLGVDLLLLPEAFIGGYPRGSTFGCAIGSRSAEGREEYRRYFRAAVDLGDTVGDGGAGAGHAWVRKNLDPDGDGASGANGDSGASGNLLAGAGSSRRGDGTREKLEDISRRTGVFLVVGCIERAGGSLYCAVVYVCPKLGMIGKRRKVMPTGSERLIWAQGSPATLRAVSTTIRGVRINMAAAICWESYMPLLRQALYAQNINLYLAPTADGRDAWLSLMRTVGAEGRCFVVSSNMCVRSSADGARGRRAGASLHMNYRAESGAPAVSSPPVSMSPEQSPRDMRRQRRESVITDDGFEIALPPLGDRPRTISPATTTTKSRRKSVFDEDGNEIVLCCKADDGSDGDAQCAAGVHDNRADTSAVASAPAPATIPAPRDAAQFKMGTANSAGSEAFVSRGGSCITGPFGDVLAGPQWEDDEGILFADVDFEDCIRGRLDLDAGGSYSRNDSFKFSVEGLDLSPLPY